MSLGGNLYGATRKLDPTFGYTTGLTGRGGLEGVIRGILASCPEPGTGESITAYLEVTGNPCPVKCALYDPAGNLVPNGVTEERTIPVGVSMEQFDFIPPKPSVAVQDYIIVAWGKAVDLGVPYLRYGSVSGWQAKWASASYNDFPSSVSFSTLSDRAHTIYCTYTPIAPPIVGKLGGSVRAGLRRMGR